MNSAAAQRKKQEAIEFYEKKYKLGISFRGKTIDEKREASKRLAESLKEERYPNCCITKDYYNNVVCERIQLPNANEKIIIVFFHGGGLSNGSVESGRIFASYFVEKHSCVALLPNFRQAPEVCFDDILKDCYLAFKGIRTHYEKAKIVLSGISSGGLLVLSLMQYLRKQHQKELYPDAIILGSTISFLDNNKESNLSLATHDIILRSYDDERLRLYAPNDEYGRGVFMNPLEGVYEGFPPTYISCGSDERLLDDSVKLFKKIKSSVTNGDSFLSVSPGMWHGYQEDNVSETFEELDRMWRFIDRYVSNRQ